MSYQRIIKTTHGPELYKLAIMADFEERNYSVVVIRTNHSHSSMEHRVLATYPNIQEATRDYNQHIAKQESQACYKCFFEARTQPLM